ETSLIKAGGGELELRGNNTFTGDIHVIGGILTAAKDSAFGMGERIFLDQGSLSFLNPFSSNKSLSVARRGNLVSREGLVEFKSIQNDGLFVLSGNGTLRFTESGLHLGRTTFNGGSIEAAGLQGGEIRFL